MMMQKQRIWAALEMALLIVLWGLTVWLAWQWTGASAWTLRGIESMAATVAVSLLLRRPSWRDSGLSFVGFWSGMLWGGLFTLCFLGSSLFLWSVTDISFPSLSEEKVVRAFVSGMLQEAFFLGYALQRWHAALQNWKAAVVANAVILGWIHLPDPGLVGLSILSGVLFGLLFLRVRNVWGFGLAHGVFTLLVLPVLLQVGLIQTMKVGPPSFASFVKTIQSELQPGDQVWLASPDLNREEFARALNAPVCAIKDDQDFKRSLVSLLSAGKPRVFLVVKEQDLNRYWGSELRDRLFILTDRYEGRLSFKTEIPFLGVLRDRVLLVSNRSLNNALPHRLLFDSKLVVALREPDSASQHHLLSLPGDANTATQAAREQLVPFFRACREARLRLHLS